MITRWTLDVALDEVSLLLHICLFKLLKIISCEKLYLINYIRLFKHFDDISKQQRIVKVGGCS